VASGRGRLGPPRRLTFGRPSGLQLVVPDIHAARAELLERGLDVGEVQEFPWGWFVFFADPDGNGWAVQQIPPRA
jgi:hypothetical protein